MKGFNEICLFNCGSNAEAEERGMSWLILEFLGVVHVRKEGGKVTSAIDNRDVDALRLGRRHL